MMPGLTGEDWERFKEAVEKAFTERFGAPTSWRTATFEYTLTNETTAEWGGSVRFDARDGRVAWEMLLDRADDGSMFRGV